LHIQAERFHVKLMKIANAGNHLHLVVKAKTVEGFKGFLRAVTGAIAKFCRGLEAREMNAIEARERQAGGVASIAAKARQIRAGGVARSNGVLRGLDVPMGAKNPGAMRKAEGGVIAAETKATGHDHGSDGPNAQKAEAKSLKAAGHELMSHGRSANQSPNIKEKFWDQRPFTKILEWGRMHRAALKYLTQNMLEAIGFIPYQERTRSRRAECGQPMGNDERRLGKRSVLVQAQQTG